MQMQFKVTYGDGRVVESTAKPKDFVAFERQYNIPLSALDVATTSLEHIYYLAWSPLHRSGMEPGVFDEFLDRIDEVEMVNEEPVDPTPPAASPELSPESPSEAA